MARTLRKASVCHVAGLAIALVAGGSAVAADLDNKMPVKAIAAPAAPPSGWTYRFTPYVWATSLNGSATVKGRTTDIDASFIDILNHTQFPVSLLELAGYAEARTGRVSLFTDVVYMKAGIGAGILRTRSVDELNGTVGASLGLTVQMVIAQMAAAYEIASWGSVAGAPGYGTALDLYGGARVWWQRVDASLALAGTLNVGDLSISGSRAIAASGDVSWADPLVGARLRHQFAPGKELVISGDVGGFGAASKISWQAVGAFNFDITKIGNAVWGGMIGYRALYVDYSKGSGLTHYEYNILEHGPIVGINARF